MGEYLRQQGRHTAKLLRFNGKICSVTYDQKWQHGLKLDILIFQPKYTAEKLDILIVANNSA